MKRWLVLILGISLAVWVRADYSDNPDAQLLIDELTREEGLERARLERVLADASYQQSIVDAMNRPAERVLSWGEYRDIFMRDNRIDGGAEFWSANLEVLTRAQEEFGVPAEVIVAIIGVETLYGRITGSYRVIDALATLAFDYPSRATFFRSELKHFLTFTAEHDRDPLEFLGSYAGAMGYGQFMPSSYRRYARDYNGDGFADLWTSEADAIWSVANYLSGHGWRRGEPIAEQVRLEDDFDIGLVSEALRPDTSLDEWRSAGVQDSGTVSGDAQAILVQMQGHEGEEFWLGYHNFYVITRYNISDMYALAVFQLGEAIAERHRERGQ